MSVAVTPIYAGLVALLFVWLSARVIQFRRDHALSLGDGGERDMIKRVRAHANCAEYAPLGLVLMLLAELQGAPALALHLLGATLLVGRVMHAVGLSSTPQKSALRIGGMVLTFTSITFAALGLVGHALI